MNLQQWNCKCRHLKGALEGINGIQYRQESYVPLALLD